MANQVYANGMEIACKAASGKSTAAFPDTCLTPPPPPAGPVPVPYPNTASASDTTKGTTTVMISGQEVMMKDQSTFSKSTGDEAATRAQGMGVVTHIIQGEASFVAWSMDVKFEGANVDRHLDPMLHNEQCNPANTPPMMYVDASAFGTLKECAGDKQKMEEACGKPSTEKKPCPGVLNVPKQTQREQVAKAPSRRMAVFAAFADEIKAEEGSRTFKAAAAAEAEANGSECVKKSRCYLRPYEPGDGQDGCCPGQTGHHLPPKACSQGPSGGYLGSYDPSSALCVCMEGMSQHCGSHGKNHAAIEFLASKQGIKPGQRCNVKDYNSLCAKTVEAQCGCNKACIEAQLNQQAEKNKVNNVRHVDTNSSSNIDEFKNQLSTSAPPKAVTGR